MNIFSRFWKLSKLLFILLNIGISLLGFLRSFVFLKYLDFYELGMVSILQTIILLIALSQIGILNGAYRAYSGTKKYYRIAINNFTFSFFIILTVVCLIISVLYLVFNFSNQTFILLLGIVAGIFSLMTNYLNNALLADSKINEINFINLFSNLLGFSALFLIFYHPLLGLLSFVIQPFSFLLISFIVDRSLIPRRFFISLTVFRVLFKLGWIPYATSLFVYLNLQIERWAIVYYLGIETFGHFYLPVAYSALFALFPNSINNLFFASMVRAHSENRTKEFNDLLKQYNYTLLFYCAASAVATLWLAPYFIEIFFPQHVQNLQYVYLTLPGLIAITIAAPYIVYFNASLNLRPLLFSYGASTAVIIIIIFLLNFTDNISLKTIAIADSVGNVSICLLALFAFFSRKTSTSSLKLI